MAILGHMSISPTIRKKFCSILKNSGDELLFNFSESPQPMRRISNGGAWKGLGNLRDFYRSSVGHI